MLPLPPSDPSSPDKYLRDFEPEESRRDEHSRSNESRKSAKILPIEKKKKGKKERKITVSCCTLQCLRLCYGCTLRVFRHLEFRAILFILEICMEYKNRDEGEIFKRIFG